MVRVHREVGRVPRGAEGPLELVADRHPPWLSDGAAYRWPAAACACLRWPAVGCTFHREREAWPAVGCTFRREREAWPAVGCTFHRAAAGCTCRHPSSEAAYTCPYA